MLSVPTSLAIDLGTATTIIYGAGTKLLLAAPSAVAFTTAQGRTRTLAAGSLAAQMHGRTRHGTQVVWPVRSGMIVDAQATALMLKAFVRMIYQGRVPRLKRVLISIPCGVTPVEQRGFWQAAASLQPDDITLVYEPLAATVGAGIADQQARGRMLVDVGGGTTEAIVTSMGQIATSRSVRTGGDALNRQIADFVRQRYALEISDAEAERCKRLAAPALDQAASVAVPVLGRCQQSRLPRRVMVQAHELKPVFAFLTGVVAQCIEDTLSATAPELVADLADDGIWLSGGCLLVPGMPAALAARLPVRFRIVQDPLTAVAMGNARLLASPRLLATVGAVS